MPTPSGWSSSTASWMTTSVIPAACRLRAAVSPAMPAPAMTTRMERHLPKKCGKGAYASQMSPAKRPPGCSLRCE